MGAVGPTKHTRWLDAARVRVGLGLASGRRSTRWLGDCRRDVCRANTRLVAIASARCVVTATRRASYPLAVGSSDPSARPKPSIDNLRLERRIKVPVGHLGKTLGSTCRECGGQAWTTAEPRDLSTSINRLSLDHVHRSSTDHDAYKRSGSGCLRDCPQSPPPLRIRSTNSLLSSSFSF